MKFVQKLSLIDMKRKYMTEKLAARAILSYKQKNKLA